MHMDVPELPPYHAEHVKIPGDNRKVQEHDNVSNSSSNGSSEAEADTGREMHTEREIGTPTEETSLKQVEPMLAENPHRFTMFPIEHDEVFDMFKKSKASFWTAEEVDLSQDYKDFCKLNADEQHFVKHVLAFFAASDGIVLENLAMRFMKEVQWAEARAFYGFQIMMENEHSLMYSLLIDTLVKDTQEKLKLFQAIDHMPCVKDKAQWAQRWIGSTDNFATRLIAFAAVEGIFFSASFCAIFWLKKRNLMPGLAFSNELIARDEACHVEFAVLLYNQLVNKLEPQQVQKIIAEAVEVEEVFVRDSLPVSLIGMNADLMVQYVQFVADRLLLSLHCDKLYRVENPFEWMEAISLSTKTSFFEHKVAAYQKAGVMNTADERAFTLDADF